MANASAAVTWTSSWARALGGVRRFAMSVFIIVDEGSTTVPTSGMRVRATTVSDVAVVRSGRRLVARIGDVRMETYARTVERQQ